MTFNPEIHHRQSIRLRGYDYAQQGAYFITVCTHNKLPLFGNVVDGKMVLNEMGNIVHSTWTWLSKQYDYVQLDEFVVMPNHFHGVLIIDNSSRGDSRIAPTNDIARTNAIARTGGSRTAPTKTKTVGSLIGAFKTVSIKEINRLQQETGTAIWQRNYYERIVRNEMEFKNIREYIVNNPMQWALDEMYVP